MPIMFKDHNGTEHDFLALPPATQAAIVGRGVSHVFGNECASIVVGKIRRAICGPDGKPNDVTTAQVQGYRAENNAAVAGFLAMAQDAKLVQILVGTLGVHVGGTSVDPLTRKMVSIARQEIRSLFKKQGWTFPGADETFKMGDADLSADEIVARWLDGADKTGTFGKAGDENKPRIERLAQRELKAQADKAKQVANADTTGLAESLGL